MIHRLLLGDQRHARARQPAGLAPLDRALSLLWVTPNMHKVHHSRERAETDSNYGNILSIYDRVLRTFTPTDRAFSVVYGLDDVGSDSVPSRCRGCSSMPFQAVESSAARESAGCSGRAAHAEGRDAPRSRDQGLDTGRCISAPTSIARTADDETAARERSPATHLVLGVHRRVHRASWRFNRACERPSWRLAPCRWRPIRSDRQR